MGRLVAKAVTPRCVPTEPLAFSLICNLAFTIRVLSDRKSGRESTTSFKSPRYLSLHVSVSARPFPSRSFALILDPIATPKRPHDENQNRVTRIGCQCVRPRGQFCRGVLCIETPFSCARKTLATDRRHPRPLLPRDPFAELPGPAAVFRRGDLGPRRGQLPSDAAVLG